MTSKDAFIDRFRTHHSRIQFLCFELLLCIEFISRPEKLLLCIVMGRSGWLRGSVFPYLFESGHELVDFECDFGIDFLYLIFVEAEGKGVHLEFGHFDEGGGLKEAVEYSSEGDQHFVVGVVFSVGFKFFWDILLHAVQLLAVGDDLGPHEVAPLADDLQLLEFLHLDEISQIFIEDLDA